MVRQAMIFAAGVGSRLKPFTDHHPKGLVEIGDKPMLDIVILNLIRAGIERIVINIHHFGEQITAFLANRNFPVEILISDEREKLLDTGGGLAKAAGLFYKDQPVLLHNADILTGMPISSFINTFETVSCDALLSTADRQSSRKLLFDRDGRLQGWENCSNGQTRPADIPNITDLQRLAFNGIHIVSWRIIEMLQRDATEEEIFSMTPFYLNHINNLDIRCHTTNYNFFDVGKPQTLEQARQYHATRH